MILQKHFYYYILHSDKATSDAVDALLRKFKLKGFKKEIAIIIFYVAILLTIIL